MRALRVVVGILLSRTYLSWPSLVGERLGQLGRVYASVLKQTQVLEVLDMTLIGPNGRVTCQNPSLRELFNLMSLFPLPLKLH